MIIFVFKSRSEKEHRDMSEYNDGEKNMLIESMAKLIE